MSIIVTKLISDYGVSYIPSLVISAIVLQYIFTKFKMERIMKYIPRSVLSGSANAFAVIVIWSQISICIENTGMMLMLTGLTIFLIYFLSEITDFKFITSTLASVAGVTILSLATGSTTISVASVAGISGDFVDSIFTSDIFDAGTWIAVLPYAFSLVFVGMIEAAPSAGEAYLETRGTEVCLREQSKDICLPAGACIREETGNDSSKFKIEYAEGRNSYPLLLNSEGYGFVSAVCSIAASMPGCSVIKKIITDATSGSRKNFINILSGVILGLFLTLGESILNYIPMAAFAGVMITIALSSFRWGHMKELVSEINPGSSLDLAVIAVTMAASITTSNLALGAMLGAASHYAAMLVKKRAANPAED